MPRATGYLASVPAMPEMGQATTDDYLKQYAKQKHLRGGVLEGSAEQYYKTLSAINARMVREHIGAGLLEIMAGIETKKELEAATEKLEETLDQMGREVKGKPRKPLAPRTRFTYIGILQGFYEWALKKGLVSVDPSVEMTKPKVHKGKPKPIKERELEQLLMHVGWKRPLRTWILLGSYSSLRRAEMARMEYEWLDWDTETITVLGKGLVTRTLAMHPIIKNEMAFYLYAPNLKGRIFNVHPDSVGAAISRAMESCGIDSSAHPLRHRFATQMYRHNGHDIYSVKAAMGHASISTTEIYTEVDEEAVAAGIAALPLVGGTGV